MLLPSCSLEGKIALVTGGSRGIGAAIAEGLAGAGADVAVASRTIADLERVAKEIRALGRRSLPVQLNVRRKEEIDKAVERVLTEFGRIDILVNNAGVNPGLETMMNTSEKFWDVTMEINLKGYFLMCQAVGKGMMEHKSGAIINVASYGAIIPLNKMGVYGTSKAGVIMLTRTLARELGEFGIRVNCIAPGVTDTRMAADYLSKPQVRERESKRIPLGHIGQPEDIIGTAVYFASDMSAFVTGQTIIVDGGGTLVF